VVKVVLLLLRHIIAIGWGGTDMKNRCWLSNKCEWWPKYGDLLTSNVWFVSCFWARLGLSALR